MVERTSAVSRCLSVLSRVSESEFPSFRSRVSGPEFPSPCCPEFPSPSFRAVEIWCLSVLSRV